jgi:hypothetical protein
MQESSDFEIAFFLEAMLPAKVQTPSAGPLQSSVPVVPDPEIGLALIF